MKAVQKICFHGNSANVTLARHLLFALGWRPGDFVELSVDKESGELHIRPFVNREYAHTKSPGIVPEAPAIGSK